jgi:hypothetical protein
MSVSLERYAVAAPLMNSGSGGRLSLTKKFHS